MKFCQEKEDILIRILKLKKKKGLNSKLKNLFLEHTSK